jgi:hypothetical protein
MFAAQGIQQLVRTWIRWAKEHRIVENKHPVDSLGGRSRYPPCHSIAGHPYMRNTIFFVAV